MHLCMYTYICMYIYIYICLFGSIGGCTVAGPRTRLSPRRAPPARREAGKGRKKADIHRYNMTSNISII